MAYGSCDLEQVLVTPGLRFVIGRVSRSALHHWMVAPELPSGWEKEAN